MTTYTVTALNYNSPAFWNSISESASGHVLDFTGLPSSFFVSVKPDVNLIWIWDGSAWNSIGEAGSGAEYQLGAPTELHFFTEVRVGDSTAELSGSSANETLFSGAGNDTIDGGAGNDSIDGGAGNDSLLGGGGADSVLGGAGADTLIGGTGADTLIGGSGSDSLSGGYGRDSLSGGDGDDTLIGGSEWADIITSEDFSSGPVGWTNLASGTSVTANESIAGDAFMGRFAGNGTGAEQVQKTFDLTDGAPHAVIEFDFLKIDTWDEGQGESFTVYIDGVAAFTFYPDGANSSVHGDGADASGTFAGGTWEITSSGTDSNLGFGNGGAVAHDRVYEVRIVLDTPGDTVTLGIGARLNQPLSDESWGIDNVNIASTSDAGFQFGDDPTDDDVIDGGAGNDILRGGTGNDSLSGGDDSDTFVLEDRFGTDTITGGEGGTDTDRIDASQVTSGVTVFFTGTEAGNLTSGLNSASFTGIEQFTLTAQDDVLDGASRFGAMTVDGGAGNDTISGSTGRDSLIGGSGDDSLIGGFGADTILGGDGGDVLRGEGQADSLEGGSGADTLFGGADTDTLLGDDGNDSLDGGEGNDRLEGGLGADTLIGGGGNDSMSGGDDADTFILGNSFGNDTIAGGEGGTDFDTINLSAVTSGVTVTYTGSEAGTLVQGSNSVAFSQIEGLTLTALNDSVNGAANTGAMTVDGGAGNDTLRGGSGNDTLLGGDGRDRLYGGAGDDRLEGGAGSDGFYSDAGDDLILGGSGRDDYYVTDGFGNDTVDLGSEEIVINSGSASEFISFYDVTSAVTITYTGSGGTATDGTNTITFDNVDGWEAALMAGGSFDARLATFDVTYYDYGGATTAYGSAFSDFIVAYDADASDRYYDGGAGDDTLDTGGGNDTILGGTGNDDIFARGGNDLIDGGDGNDTIIGGDGADTIAGGDGDDFIDGGDGDDFLTTGLGNDTLIGGTGNDTLMNSDGDDRLVGGAGDDLIIATGGNDTLEGGDGNDTLDGGADNDSLVGGAGDDILEGGSGNDHMDGGDDQDMFIVADGFGNDTIVGGEGGTDFDTIDLSLLSGPVTVTYTGDEAGTITDGNGNTITFSQIERLILTDQADSVDGSLDGAGLDVDAGAGDDTLYGGLAEDTLMGGDGADSLNAGADNDSVDGGAGNDTIDAGTGDDTVDGGDGNDLVFAWTGNDSVLGGIGDDTIFGQDGNDTIYGGAGHDSLDGDDGAAGADLIFGEEGNDTIIGDAGNDTLSGGSGDDSIFAGADDDSVTGGAGNDWISGESGNDTLEGGTGDDTLLGGDGTDTFIYTAGDGNVTIGDFNTGNTGTLSDGNSTNNDFINLSAFYDDIWELHADQADDGVLNQSNDGVDGVDYSNNASFGSGSLTFTGASADNTFFTSENTGVVCFASGTAIRTPAGEVLVETLRAGDLVKTQDHGPSKVLWIGCTEVVLQAGQVDPRRTPVRIKPDVASGARALLVSPQHCLLMTDATGQPVLARAHHLAEETRLAAFARGRSAVTYWHVLLERHSVLLSQGRPSESFYPGPNGLAMMAPPERARLLRALPALRTAPVETAYGPRTLKVLTRSEVLRNARSDAFSFASPHDLTMLSPSEH